MATYSFIGAEQYRLDSGTTFRLDVGAPTPVNGTLDDQEADTTFEQGDPFAFSGSEFFGSIDLPLPGGGSIRLPVATDIGTSGNPTEFLIFNPFTTDGPIFPATIDLSDIDQSSFTVCFAAGTRIQTVDGDRPVETLRIGDLIRTAAGNAVPLKWLGRQTLWKWSDTAALVRIRAGAFGGGLPTRDLTVTADHGMVIDGHVINASALVNHDTIDFVPMAELADNFTVYHIETQAHDVILANGAPSETFIDVASRRNFDNHQEYLDLYGTERIIGEMPIPRISSPRLMPKHLMARLGSRKVA